MKNPVPDNRYGIDVFRLFNYMLMPNWGKRCTAICACADAVSSADWSAGGGTPTVAASGRGRRVRASSRVAATGVAAAGVASTGVASTGVAGAAAVRVAAAIGLGLLLRLRLGRRLGLMGQLRDLSNQVLVDKVKQTMDQANIDKTNIDAVCDRLMIRAIPI